MDNLFLKLVEQKEGFESTTPASEESIAEAEKKLGLFFSQEYKEYLLKYGAVSYHGHIFTGISPFPGIDVVAVTVEARQNNPQVPLSYYVIEEAHIDGLIIWQDASGTVYRTVPGHAPMKMCRSLVDYIGE